MLVLLSSMTMACSGISAATAAESVSGVSVPVGRGGV